jgi:HEAT repeat protein
MDMRSRNPKALAMAFASVLTLGGMPAFAQSKIDEAWEILRVNLNEKDTAKRALAVHVLGLLPGDPQAQELSHKAVEDEKPEVRAAAATALGQLRSKTAIPWLHALLSDDEPSVALAAASALIAFKDPAAYDVYYEFLVGERKSSKGVIAEQMKTLKDKKKMAEIGVEEGIGFIPYAGIGLSAFKTLHADDVSPVRAAAAKMLIDDPDPETGQALVEASSDKSWVVKTAALEALAKRGDPLYLDSILPAMSDDNTSVRCTAAAAVIHLSGVSASKPARRKNTKLNIH